MMATRNPPPLYERIESAVFSIATVVGQALLLVLFVGLLWLSLIVIDAMINAPQPFESCGTTAIGTEICNTRRGT